MIFILSSYTLFLTYLFIGIYSSRINLEGTYDKRHSTVCLLLAFCSLMEIVKDFTYLSEIYDISLFIIRTICLFVATVTLEIALLTIQKKLSESIKLIRLLYLPPFVFSICEIFIMKTLGKFYAYDGIRNFEVFVMYMYLLACIYIYFKKYESINNQVEKKAIKTILYFGIICFVLTGTNNCILILFGENYISYNQFIVFLFVCAVFFSNKKYKLYNPFSMITSEQVVEEINEMVILIDLYGKIVEINRRTEEVLGFKRNDFVGLHINSIMDFNFSIALENIENMNSYEPIEELNCKTIKGETVSVSAKMVNVKAKRYREKKGILLFLIDNTTLNELQTEINERINKEEQLSYMSTHDALTGLYNRNYFNQVIHNLNYEHYSSLGIIMCDLDGLKLINDTLGHDSGDYILNQASKIILKSISDSEILCRVGGDEFAIILLDCNEKRIYEICNKIKKSIRKFNKINKGIPLSISMGYSFSKEENFNAEHIIKEADNYMYREKLYNTHSFRNSTIQALTKTLEARDFITEGHGERLKDMALKLGKHMGLPNQKILDLQLLAQFHDLGKVGVPDSILFKPSFLTESEIMQMQRHSEIGYKIAQVHPDLSSISNLILRHHERWDGKGYPLKLEKEQIPLECRILSIIDAFDAMMNDRPYRKKMLKKDAILELKNNSGTQFDPYIVNNFIKMLG